MKKFISLIITPLILFTATAASAVVLTFDDVPGGSIQNSYGNMPTYEGFNFSSTLDWIDVESVTWNFGAHSGDFALVNNELGAGFIISADAADFSFGGLWAKEYGTPPDSGGADSIFGNISGFKDSIEVWNIEAGLNGSYQYFGPQTALIDELRIDFGNRNLFLVDDIELTAVPVPAAAWLFGSGLIGLASIARRKPQV